MFRPGMNNQIERTPEAEAQRESLMPMRGSVLQLKEVLGYFQGEELPVVLSR